MTRAGNESAQKSGAAAEALALAWLLRQGLKLIERNYRVRGGEIDLICRDGDSLVFIEVRLRRHAAFGGAAESITRHKRRRIILAAQHYLAGKPQQACRFDCILLDTLEETRIEWIKGAFALD